MTAPEPQINWLQLSRALSGLTDPTHLDADTLAEHQKIIAQGQQQAEPTEAELAVQQFWSEVREIEAANDAKAQEVGYGTPEHDEWIYQIRVLNGDVEPREEPKRKRRAPAKKTQK